MSEVGTGDDNNNGVDVASNLQEVQSNIAKYEQEFNRPKNSVRLVAVSKTKPVEELMKAYNVGQRRFGENYVQELVQKAQEMPEDVEWHFIGPLQSNKAAMLVKNVPSLKCVETVSTTKLASKLNRAVDVLESSENKKLGIYIQVNTSGEESKSGVSTPDEAMELANFITKECPNLELQGLMTIGAPNDDTCFDTLMEYRNILAPNYPSLELELSMGMSGDYPQAIAKGSTSVRVGSTIFGHRDYTTST